MTPASAFLETLPCLLSGGGVVAVFVIWVVREGRINDRHKRQMLAKWFCPECGYRVHAAASDRCPECGTRIPPKFPPYGGR